MSSADRLLPSEQVEESSRDRILEGDSGSSIASSTSTMPIMRSSFQWMQCVASRIDSELLAKTYRSFIRNTATVIVASGLRLGWDTLFLWAAGCSPLSPVHGASWNCLGLSCVEFVCSILLAGFVVWRCQEWLVDPSANPLALKMSWGIVTGALEWTPLSIAVGMVSQLVELIHSASISFFHLGLSLLLAGILTLLLASCLHVALKHGQRWVFAPGSAGQYVLLLSLYCLGPAVGSSWWLALNTAVKTWCVSAASSASLYPSLVLRSEKSVPLAVLVGLSISAVCIRFYCTYGPEPIMPADRGDLHLRSLSSVKRSVLSFLVYASVLSVAQAWIFVLWRGLLAVHAEMSSFPDEASVGALGVAMVSASVVTLGCIAAAFAVARSTPGVGFGVSTATSRSRGVGPGANVAPQTLMAFDLAVLVSASQWGKVITGLSVLLCGWILPAGTERDTWSLFARLRSTVYVLGVLLYVVIVAALTSRLCLIFVPSESEKTTGTGGVPPALLEARQRPMLPLSRHEPGEEEV